MKLIRPGERTGTSPEEEFEEGFFQLGADLKRYRVFCKKPLLCSLSLACKDKGVCILFGSEQKSLDCVLTSFLPTEKKLQEIKSVVATQDEDDMSDLRGCKHSDTTGLWSDSIHLCDHLRLKTRLAAMFLRYSFIHPVAVESFESFPPCRTRLKL